MVGLVIPDLVNPLFAEIAKDLAIELKKHKYFIIIASSGSAHLRGPENNIGNQRFEGFRDTLAAHGMALREQYVIPLRKADTEGRAVGQAAVKQLLALNPRPDAIFCYNDNSAVGAIDAIFDGEAERRERRGNRRVRQIPLRRLDRGSVYQRRPIDHADGAARRQAGSRHDRRWRADQNAAGGD